MVQCHGDERLIASCDVFLRGIKRDSLVAACLIYWSFDLSLFFISWKRWGPSRRTVCWGMRPTHLFASCGQRGRRFSWCPWFCHARQPKTTNKFIINSSIFSIKIWLCKKTTTYISDLNLDGGVVVGRDECVGGGTLSWNVQVDNFVLIVLHYRYRFIF